MLIPQDHRAADRGRDAAGHPHIQREAGAAEPGAELPAAQEARQPARPGQKAHRLADNRLFCQKISSVASVLLGLC